MEELSPDNKELRFASLRDQALYLTCRNGWANASDDRHGKLAWYAKVSNSPEELEELVEAFSPELDELGFTDTTQLLGHFLVYEAKDGSVAVAEYDSAEERDREYQHVTDHDAVRPQED